MGNGQLPLFGRDAKPDGLDVVALMALSKIHGVGFKTLRGLLEQLGQLSHVWDASDDELNSTLSRLRLPRPSSIIQEIKTEKDKLIHGAKVQLDAFRRRNISVMMCSDPRFPSRLSEIPAPPYWLFVEGNLNLLSQPNLIAVVGTRNPTALGIRYAKKITALLAKNGFCIVSGLAEGIDAAVHKTALDFGAPCVAVLGTGISVVFPRTTADLRQKVVESGGALVTEYLPYESYQKARFVQRNRIQAALSCAVIPVEWNEKGGTAHTVRFAEQYGRMVITIAENHPARRAGAETNRHRFSVSVESPEAETELLNVLHIDRESVPQDARQSKSSIGAFSGLLAEFRRIISDYPISEREYEALRSGMQEDWQKLGKSHDDKGSDSRS